MAIYELRTYTVTVGKMNDVVALYKSEGWPALSKHPQKLCGYFTGDIGALNQLVHLWKFDDDADRRAFWAGVYSDQAFMNFAKQLRPMLQQQETNYCSARHGARIHNYIKRVSTRPKGPKSAIK